MEYASLRVRQCARVLRPHDSVALEVSVRFISTNEISKYKSVLWLAIKANIIQLAVMLNCNVAEETRISQ